MAIHEEALNKKLNKKKKKKLEKLMKLKAAGNFIFKNAIGK